MSYLGNSYLKEFVIGGGLYTATHKASGGYRLDIAHTTGLNRAWWDYEKILEAPNGDGTNYAVFRLVGTDYYLFAVHIKNARSAKRGEVAFDLVASKFLHVHIKIGGYSSTVTKYLKYLEHLDPSIKISTNYGSNAYTGLNKGVHLPITSNPMTFNYELYVKNNNLYMRVTSGSINANATVKNVTKGTSWQVFCNKSVGNDGGAINTGMEEALYEVIASGIVRQYDNRPAPVDPCASVKTELANANKIIATKDSEINKLNGALGGMTTDRNKFKNLSEELQSSLDNKTAEINRLNLELEDSKKLSKQLELKLDIAENELSNVAGKFSELDKLVAQQSAKIVHQSTELTKLSDALAKCKENKGLTLAEFLQGLIDTC
jgi:hypothetical protein